MKRTTVALGATAAIGLVRTTNAFALAPSLGSVEQVGPSLHATVAARTATPDAQPTTSSNAAAIAAGTAIAAVGTSMASKRGQGAKGKRQHLRVRVVRKVMETSSEFSRMEIGSCDDHDSVKGDQEFDFDFIDAPSDVEWVHLQGKSGSDPTPAKDSTTVVLPLFPLNAVKWPGTNVRLNIMQPAFRQMFDDILVSGSRTFLVPFSPCIRSGPRGNIRFSEMPDADQRVCAIGAVCYLEDLEEKKF